MSAGVAEVKELARRRGGLQSCLGCMPSTGGERLGFTDNHFHDPKVAQSSCSGGVC